MPKAEENLGDHVERYKDGSVKARGCMVNGNPEGYWEWFRQDGSKMRSGYFSSGLPVGEWVTYDRKSQVYKVTQKKA